MKLTGLHIPGYRLKDGKLIPTTKGKAVSKRIAEKKSKKIRVVKRMAG